MGLVAETCESHWTSPSFWLYEVSHRDHVACLKQEGPALQIRQDPAEQTQQGLVEPVKVFARHRREVVYKEEMMRSSAPQQLAPQPQHSLSPQRL